LYQFTPLTEGGGGATSSASYAVNLTAGQMAISASGGDDYAVLQSLPAMALLLADGGEVERAVELYALALRSPYAANSRWFEDVTGKQIKAFSEMLPPEVVAAAQERGRVRDLEATVRELLDELGGSPSG
jgi:hypothetical protein